MAENQVVSSQPQRLVGAEKLLVNSRFRNLGSKQKESPRLHE